jgi:O-antigen ligase
MNRKLSQKPNNNLIPINLIFLGCALITLYFNSQLQDPFNSPKFWLLIILSSYLLGYLVVLFKNIVQVRTLKVLLSMLLAFNLAGVIAALSTDVKFIAFMGDSQRRNGFLTYLALSVVMLATALTFKVESVNKLHKVAFLSGLLLSIYGLMQISGLDFVDWNNPYNAIISTVGNPNFAAAIMSIMALLIFAPVLNSSYSKLVRISSFILTILILYTIFLSDARQGLLAFFAGLLAYMIIWAFIKSKRLGYIFLLAGAFVGLLAIAGMLQKGPLSSLLYKGSVTVRGYYWDAGIAMVRANPFFGVGYDSYGSYFKEYREVGYPLKYGFGITSSNAHNLPIQIFSTSGIFAGTAYMAITIFIFVVGLRAILRASNNQKLQIGGVLSAWIAYQAQSIVSIDNIGISVWGWALGGAVLGTSFLNSSLTPTQQNKKLADIQLLRPVISFILVVFTLVTVVIPHYQAERDMLQVRILFDPAKPEYKDPFRQYAEKIINYRLADPSYKMTVAGWLAANGYVEDGLNQLYKMKEYDPRNLDTLIVLAQFNEELGRYSEAIKLRKEVIKYDQWDATNYLQLGKNYKLLGEFGQMDQMLEKILSFASNTELASKARVELTRS